MSSKELPHSLPAILTKVISNWGYSLEIKVKYVFLYDLGHFS